MLVICWFMACSPKQMPTPTPAPSAAEPAPEAPEPPTPDSRLVASLSKSPCFGNCPAFEVWIYSDGSVLWCGEAHVERIGHFKASAPAEWLEAWFNAAEDTGYWNMNGWYPANRKTLQDVPITVSYLRHGKKERRIVNNADAPLALLRLEKFWQEKLEELTWIPDQGNP
jgi:hypothetical protein